MNGPCCVPKSVPVTNTAVTRSPTASWIRSPGSPGRSRTAARRPRRRSRAATTVLMYHSAMSRMPLGCFSHGAGTRAMSPKAVPPKLARIAAVARRRRAARPRGEMGQVVVGDRAELLQVVLDVELVVVDRLLADDGVEVEAALGHAAAGRRRAVALGIHAACRRWAPARC